MKKRFALVVALLFALSLVGVGGAAAHDEANTEFDFHIGDAFLAAATGDPANGNGDVARAANGDTITIRGSGAFDTKNGEAEGNGTFVHRNSLGTVLASGTWTAKRLISFNDAGTSTNLAFPRTFHGGDALIRVRVSGHPAANPEQTIKFDATLAVHCELPGAGTQEGVTLDAGSINFDTLVSGVTVFVAHDDD